MSTQQNLSTSTRKVWWRAVVKVWWRAGVWLGAQILWVSLLWLMANKLDVYAYARFLLASNMIGFFVFTAILLYPRRTD